MKQLVPGETTPFTPEGTIGPFFPGYFMASQPGALDRVAPILTHRPRGQAIELVLRFWDSDRKPVPGVIVESWQANAEGRYRHPAQMHPHLLDPQFDGFLRVRSNEEGMVRIRTIKPGAHTIPDTELVRAPHLRLTLFASGIDRLVTQVFFEGEDQNGVDPLLHSLTDPRVRLRLVARRSQSWEVDGSCAYELPIVLRGENETPFFDDWLDNTGDKPETGTASKPLLSPDSRNLVVVYGDRESETRTPSQPLYPMQGVLRDGYSVQIPPPFLRVSGEADLTRIGPARPEALGKKLLVSGLLLDEELRPVRRTLIEVWNCNTYGRYSHSDDPGSPEAPIDPNFYGFGRVLTDDDGRYSVRTIKPAPYIARRDIGWWRPPHVHFSILGGGARLVTQMYFPDEPLNARDFIFAAIPPNERQRAIAMQRPTYGGELIYEHNIVVRGRYQTPLEGPISSG